MEREMPTVFVPTVMRKCVGGNSSLTVSGQTIKEVLDQVYASYPALATDKEGKIKPFVAVFVNSTALNEIAQDAPMRADDEVHFIPAIAGGCQ
jgi:molybdopterin converting factor small subunit